MENEESTWITEIFGPKDSSSTSPSPLVAAIFPPFRPPHWGQLRLSESEKKTDSVTQSWSAKKAVSGEEEKKWSQKEKTSYLEEEKPQPFHYSSSIYYGGPVHVPTAPTLNDNVRGEDDSGIATIGNWWQGSVYY